MATSQRTRRTNTPTPPRRLANIATAAAWLDCTERTVRRMISDGELSAFRIGRHLKIDLNEVEALMQPIDPNTVGA